MSRIGEEAQASVLESQNLILGSDSFVLSSAKFNADSGPSRVLRVPTFMSYLVHYTKEAVVDASSKTESCLTIET
jgi:hypothetical protein